MGLLRLGSALYLSWFIPVTKRDLDSECASKEITASVLCVCVEWWFTQPGSRERGPSQHVCVTGATCSITFIPFRKCEPDVLWPYETRTLHPKRNLCLLFVSVANTCLITFNSPKSLLCGIQRKTKQKKLIRNPEEGNLPSCCLSDNDGD